MNQETLLESVKSLPPAAQILPKLLTLLRNPDTSSYHIVDLISFDPSLTAQVLKLSNSAYYGVATPSYDLDEAINRIGFGETFKLVAVICGGKLVDQPLSGFCIDKGQLWEHSVACAIAMELLAQKSGEDTSVCYTIGLLHAIGKIVFNEHFADRYEEVFACVEKEGISLLESENRILGFNHAHIGAALLKKWNFSENIYVPIEFQYTPMKAESHLQLSCMIHLTYWIVAGVGLNFGKDAWAFNVDSKAFEQLEITEDQLHLHIIDVHKRLGEIKSDLGIAQKVHSIN